MAAEAWRSAAADAAFQAALLAEDRVIGTRLEMIDADGNHVDDLPFTGGSTDYDGASTEPFAVTVTLRDRRWVPVGARSILDPRSGHWCRVWWRLRKADLSWWEIPLATVKLGKPRVSVSGGLVEISLTGRDAFAVARRRGYGDKVVAVGGLTVTAALQSLFLTVAPGTPVAVAGVPSSIAAAITSAGIGAAASAVWPAAGAACAGPGAAASTARSNWVSARAAIAAGRSRLSRRSATAAR